MILLESLLLLYVGYVVAYTLIFSLAGRLRPSHSPREEAPPRSMAVLIPAYKEDAVIVATAQKVLEQAYPNFSVIVIADQLQPETLAKLRALPLQVVEVDFVQSTKVKALQAGLAQAAHPAEIAVILDADNEMAPDFLAQLNRCFAAGQRAVQGHRTAKNRNTELAVLDGLSERLNNHIYRAGSIGLGLSASLIGSAMAFEWTLLQGTLAEMDAVGGFDRDLEVRLLKQGVKVHYLLDAVVYDEKTAKQDDFARQRRRWIASQYEYLAKHAGTGLRALARGDFALFNSALLRNIQLPRVLNLGLITLLALLSLPLAPWLVLGPELWVSLWVLFGLALFLAVPLSFYDRQFFQALKALPGAFWTMVKLLFKLKGANKSFLHTSHGHTGEGEKKEGQP